jgi:hypothetical protein
MSGGLRRVLGLYPDDAQTAIKFPGSGVTAKPALSLFACPKPFRDKHIGIIQSNAIRSWLRLTPKVEVILCGDEEGTAEFCRDHQLLHIPEIARSEFGTPLLSEIFRKAELAATSRLLAYVNADIILMQDFADAVRRPPWGSFLMVGRRWDMAVTEPLDFEDPDWAMHLQRRLRSGVSLHAHTGIDYFVFSKGLFQDMPRFALGRTTFDNWLIWRARQARAPVIDATEVVACVHQNHGYSFGLVNQAAGAEVDNYATGLEARKNRRLAGGRQHIFTVRDSTHRLTRQGLTEVHPVYRFVRALMRRLPRRSDAAELLSRFAYR